MAEHVRATVPNALLHGAEALGRAVIDLAFPLRCVGCRRLGSVACASCRMRIEPAPDNPAHAPWAYDGFGRDLIAALKYRNTRAVAALAAEAMAENLVDPIRAGTGPIVVTWAPTSARRRRERGYDQAELLARELALRLDTPVTALLARADGTPQTGKDRAQRLIGPRLELRPATQRAMLDTATEVIVVDDVITTGATLASAAACLVNAGVRRVVWSAAAATPDGNWFGVQPTRADDARVQ
jgi:competence protein ComFC